jgi:SAM-dependent methyltransferase
VDKASAQWERFGRSDPYYGVFSVEEFRRDNLDAAARERFFASGEEHVARVLDSINRHVDPGFVPSTVLDHGCGVGRLVIPFAARAERVVGVDVSASMLEEARRNCAIHGVANAEFVSADRLDALGPGFDLVHSFIVLQHVPPKLGVPIFERLAALVRPGGVGVVHVAFASRERSARLRAFLARSVPLAYNLANVVRRRPWSYPHMQMNAYPLNALMDRLLRQGYEGAYLALHSGHDAPGAHASAMIMFRRSLDQRREASARS